MPRKYQLEEPEVWEMRYELKPSSHSQFETFLHALCFHEYRIQVNCISLSFLIEPLTGLFLFIFGLLLLPKISGTCVWSSASPITQLFNIKQTWCYIENLKILMNFCENTQAKSSLLMPSLDKKPPM